MVMWKYFQVGRFLFRIMKVENYSIFNLIIFL